MGRKLLEEKLSSLTNLSKEDLFKGTQENVNAKDIVDPNINITDGLLLSTLRASRSIRRIHQRSFKYC